MMGHSVEFSYTWHLHSLPVSVLGTGAAKMSKMWPVFVTGDRHGLDSVW